MDTLLKDLESHKTGEKFHDFVIDDAMFYIKKAQEALDEGLKDPKLWYRNEQINSQTFFTLFPHIYFTQQQLACTNSEPDPTHPKSNPSNTCTACELM